MAKPFIPAVVTFVCSSAVYFLTKYFFVRNISFLLRYAPQLQEKWWDDSKDDENITTNIEPFYISFSSELIEDLQDRLKNTRKKNTNNAMQKLLDYWANSYDFQTRETYINQYSHYKTNIQGLDIHYVHVKPETYGMKKVFPLLMLHGWPNSIMEFYNIIPLLNSSKHNYDFIFEVIVPSIPGFGFSSAPTTSSLTYFDMSMILKNLMLKLGHDKFYIQGGDWSILISRIMSSLFPEHVLGIHSFVCMLTERKKVPSCSYLATINKRVISSNKLLADTQYFHFHATKPETIGIGLNDSPAALATYIIEKLLMGTKYSKINDEFLQKYSYDNLIDNLMIYWTSKSITTAMRIYTEQFTESKMEILNYIIINSEAVNVPCYLSQHLSIIPSSSELRKRLKSEILDATYATLHGRFPAFEKPEPFAENIWKIINEWNKKEKLGEKKDS